MITADQLLAHAVGDYVLQSDWMANHKTSRPFVALVHALTYSIPFTLLNPSLGAWVAVPSDYDGDIRLECTRGVHFFMTREEAAAYHG